MTTATTATATAGAPENPELKAKKPKSPGEEGAFTEALAAATPQAPAPKPESVELSRAGLEANRSKQSLRADLAEKAPQTQKVAVSLNTAATIAGPKPWSKNWVFDGTEAHNPALKPLIPEKTPGARPPEKGPTPLFDTGAAEGGPAGSLAALAAVMAELRQQSGAMPSETPGAPRGASAARAKGGEKRVSPEGGIAATESGANGGTAGAAGLERELMGRLAALNGKAEAGGPGVEGGEEPARPGGLRAGKGNGLSGSEFLDTLSGARVGPGGPLGGEPAGLSELALGRAQQRPKPKLVGGGDFLPVANPLGPPGGPVPGGHRPELAMPTLVTGHVTQGAMTRERLSSEALLGVTSGIRNLTASGGGEIRVQLKPENLGNLNLRIITNGRGDVGLHIRASDEKSRRVIEESISHLKESLASNQLNLTRVEVTVGPQAQAAGGSQDGGLQQQQQQQQNAWSQQMQGGLTSWDGQNGSGNRPNGQDSEGSGRVTDLSSVRRSRATAPSPVTSRLSAGAQSRLDVMA